MLQNLCRRVRYAKLAAGIRFFAHLVLPLAMMAVVAPKLSAQKDDTRARKVVVTVKPAYPSTLKSLHIEGLVRLKATVLPNGSVSEVQVIGGNPILVENAVKAVKGWKYAVAPTQTNEEVVLNFFDR